LFLGQHQRGLERAAGTGRAVEGHQDAAEHAAGVLAVAGG
jgi:hypothetical protein